MPNTEDELLSDFKKIAEKCETDGYAEGLSDGRDSVYQAGFDTGYRDAFELAFKLGLKKAEDSKIEKTIRGYCLICEEPLMLRKTLEETSTAQRVHHEKKLAL